MRVWHPTPASISIRLDNDFFSLEGKQIFPNHVSGLRASLNRTSWSEILKLGMYEIWERDYLVSRVFHLTGIVSRWQGMGPRYSFLESRIENEPLRVSWEKRFCNSHAVPQGMWAKEFHEVRPRWEGKVSYLIYKGLFLSIGLVDSEMHVNYSLGFRSQNKKCFVLIINTESLLFPFT